MNLPSQMNETHKFFSKVAKEEGFDIGGERDYGVAQLFLPQDEMKRNQAKKMFEIIAGKEGLTLLGFRKVPVAEEVLGEKARSCMPYIMQAFLKRPEGVEKGLDFDRKLYIARRVFEQSNDNTYVVSMSSRTIVYKGMFLVGQLRTFFADLQDPDMSLPSPWFIPVSVPTPIRAGREPIRTVLSFTTVRSTRSAEMPTKCWPVRRPCLPTI